MPSKIVSTLLEILVKTMWKQYIVHYQNYPFQPFLRF